MLLSYSCIPSVKLRTSVNSAREFLFHFLVHSNVDEKIAGYLLTDIEYFLCQLAKLKMDLCTFVNVTERIFFLLHNNEI